MSRVHGAEFHGQIVFQAPADRQAEAQFLLKTGGGQRLQDGVRVRGAHRHGIGRRGAPSQRGLEIGPGHAQALCQGVVTAAGCRKGIDDRLGDHRIGLQRHRIIGVQQGEIGKRHGRAAIKRNIGRDHRE